jgi:hypothetical protein
VLDRCFIRPATVDRIRSSWIDDAIERYVNWLAEQNYAARSVFIRVPLLIRFGKPLSAPERRRWRISRLT